MEEVGAQVAHHPIYLHHHHPPLSKKRDLSFRNHHGFENENPIMGNWNPNHWEWDIDGFIAKPVEKPNSNPVPNPTPKSNSNPNPNLSLKLGVVEEALNKRVRSGSPGSSSSTYPMCQVDNCREDLSTAKDYHRRHKVCEVHSKSTKALVAMVMQRFCQQCSRFHPLSEFDEGKRSCRRRLAGHNRRRRKTTTQADDVVTMDNNPTANLDIVNLLTVLARAQGNNEDKNGNNSAVPERNQLMQILNKINNLPLHTDFPAAKLPVPESISSSFQQQQGNVIEHQKKFNGNVNNSSKSTMDLLTILSSTLAESVAPDDAVAVSQSSTHNSSSGEKINLASCNAPNLEFSSVPVMAERRSSSYQSTPVEDSGSPRVNVNLPLQLFSFSPEEDDRRPPKLPPVSKYFSSGSSNQMDDGSPSSSPVVELFPVVQKTTSKQTSKPPQKRICREITSLELFGDGRTSTRRVAADIGSFQSSPYQTGYASSSGSDLSPPSSSSSDAQDRTGRILFKLFDKDPSKIPGNLRTQIFNWLSNSPTEMESYIRPGCVVISIYVSLSSILWEQLEENLLLRVSSLVEAIDSDFWKSGRFLVHTGKQLASHKNGKIRLCKPWRTRKAPELILVTPLAVVAGMETCFTLKGRNLMNPGTKIHCTDMGGYISKDVHESPSHDTAHDEISFGNFKFDGASSSRCFIEVENDFKGNSFPVIIADALICRELRLLESELNEDTKMLDAVMSADHHNSNNNNNNERSREVVLHFLNELGWLFQRKKRTSSMQMLIIPTYYLSRFKYLLEFSIERDFCALVKELLDIFVHGNRDGDALSVWGMEMLSDVQLLHCAVKRKCRKMVDLLINYSIFTTTDDPKYYIFPPNISGPGGLTPLHLAACTSGSDDMVDCLTNDPQKIGLSCWNSLLDMNGQSPYAYAASRNNHSYNRLVAQKISDRRNGQVSLSIENERPEITQFKREIASTSTSTSARGGSSSSCTKCAVVAAKYHRRISGTQSMFHQPFIHSMLAVATVCVCVCIFFRGSPYTGLVVPFEWENLDFGTS